MIILLMILVLLLIGPVQPSPCGRSFWPGRSGGLGLILLIIGHSHDPAHHLRRTANLRKTPDCSKLRVFSLRVGGLKTKEVSR